mgnify:FL=1
MHDIVKPVVQTTWHLYRQSQDKAVSLEWEGRLEEARRLYHLASIYKERHDAGDLYEPTF